jgi:hypothetical protein
MTSKLDHTVLAGVGTGKSSNRTRACMVVAGDPPRGRLRVAWAESTGAGVWLRSMARGAIPSCSNASFGDDDCAPLTRNGAWACRTGAADALGFTGDRGVRIHIRLEIMSYLVLQVIAFLLFKFCTPYIPPPGSYQYNTKILGFHNFYMVSERFVSRC